MSSDATPAKQPGPGRLLRWIGVARWIGSVAVLVLAPKCLLCVAGYLGFATGVGLVGVELCGGTADSADLSLRSVTLVVLGVSLGTALLGWRFVHVHTGITVRNDAGRSFNQ